jgi:hypothetical protein
MRLFHIAGAFGCAVLMACSPTFDWREAALGGSSRLLFPCKPEQLAREVTLNGQTLPARMRVCDAQSITWAATEFDLADPGAAPATLTQLRHLLSLNLGADESPAAAALSPELRTLGEHVDVRVLHGHRPGGAAVTARALFFSRGEHLYQLVVLLPDEHNAAAQAAADQFFEGARWLAPQRTPGQP